MNYLQHWFILKVKFKLKGREYEWMFVKEGLKRIFFDLNGEKLRFWNKVNKDV